MQATRQQILDYLRLHRDASVKDLGRLLGLTATGVRQHLNILEQEGLVTSFEQRGKVGRPPLRYALTSLGDATFPKQYDALANALIDEVRACYGSQGLQQIVRGAASRLATADDGTETPVEGSPDTRINAIVDLLRSRGVVADWERDGEAFLLHERTCPYPEVARRNSVACAMDVAQVRQLTGMDAKLTACLVRGDASCTYRLLPPSN
ncbi:MAG: winged helix-turn-helix transcriptional regulator [Dehalococcoidia bacterium]|nr:winged helix-turn-helix transcriptional regulator [Dehalococcoidia bacterium]